MNRPSAKRVFMLGATGTIGRATVAALLARGHEVVCFVRPDATRQMQLPPGAIIRFGHIIDPASLAKDGLRGEAFDVLLSCLASRTGTPHDAWAIDYKANSDALAVAKAHGVGHMVLLSAICVQKPDLAFQKAKLAFEREIAASGMTYSIVRPTAFFKSLSGQLQRLKDGKPFLMFGNGDLTACKPISDADLAAFLADCITLPHLQNRILPIGGPGPAITPKQQGDALFRLLNKPPKFRRVPIGVLNSIIFALGLLGKISPKLRDKSELARIGRYYATQSMLVLDPATGRYDAAATPETGNDTLFDHYAKMVSGDVGDDRGDHAVF